MQGSAPRSGILAWPRHSARRQGFTLLEVVIVLAIMVLLMGIAVVSFDSVGREHELKHPVAEFERMTVEAVQRAGIYERPQVVTFDSSSFAMRYKTDADGIATKVDDTTWERRVHLPKEMKLSLRRFGAAKFAPAAGQRLIVAPGGLCEPLTARFELGDAWIEVTLDPLSGTAQEESMHIP